MLLAYGQAGGLQTHRERQRSSQDRDMMIEENRKEEAAAGYLPTGTLAKNSKKLKSAWAGAQSRVRVRSAVPVSETMLRSREVELGGQTVGGEELLYRRRRAMRT